MDSSDVVILLTRPVELAKSIVGLIREVRRETDESAGHERWRPRPNTK